MHDGAIVGRWWAALLRGQRRGQPILANGIDGGDQWRWELSLQALGRVLALVLYLQVRASPAVVTGMRDGDEGGGGGA